VFCSEALVLWELGLAAGILPAVGPVIAGGALAPIVFKETEPKGRDHIPEGLRSAGIVPEQIALLEAAFMDGQTLVTVHSARQELPSWLCDQRPASAVRPKEGSLSVA
jgi:hypothetical protein